MFDAFSAPEQPKSAESPIVLSQLMLAEGGAQRVNLFRYPGTFKPKALA
jgi:hypothetical protein